MFGLVWFGMEESLIELGRQIEAARKQKGWSAREVAARARVSPVYLRTLERGQNPKTGKPSQPAAKKLVDIATVLDLAPEGLLDLAGHDSTKIVQDDSLAVVREVEEALERMTAAATNIGDLLPFLQERAIAETRRFAAEFRLLADGSFTTTREEDLTFIHRALLTCTRQMRAVSYQDEDWWNSHYGAFYLDLHERLPDDVQLERIFLSEYDSWEKLQPTFDRHDELNIKWKVLDPNDLPTHIVCDIVIYDDSLLRSSTEAYAGGPYRAGIYTQNAVEIEKAIEDFTSLNSNLSHYKN